MSSTNSDYLSPSSGGEDSPELYDATEVLEDDGNDTEVDRNLSPENTFRSGFTSGWTQPLSGNSEICGSPQKSDRSSDNGSFVGPEQKPEGVWTKRTVTGAGMENLGNTCFLNSVLQCFVHTVPILQGILSDGQLLHSNCNKEGFCLLCALGDLVACSLTNSVISPHNIADNLSYISSSFKRFQQEDAHEFLQCFLDRLENCGVSGNKGCTSLQSDNIVKQVFGGRLVSNLKCCNCGHCSDTFEPLIDLSLEIEDADNLLVALQSFTKVERIEDPDTKFTCEECKEQVSVEKKLTFDQTPSVAVFHLKRFKNDGSFVQKIDKHVSFPLDLDLLPFTGSNEKNEMELKYVLYAVVVHIGLTSTSGHYYCFVRISPNMWCKFDDSKVVLVHEDFVLSQDAYILFYAKESTPWFTSFVETQKEFVHSSIWNTSPKSVLHNLGNSPVSPCLENKYDPNPDEAGHGIGSEHSEVDNEFTNSKSSPGFRSEDRKVDDFEIKYSRSSPVFRSEVTTVKYNRQSPYFRSENRKVDDIQTKYSGASPGFISEHRKVDYDENKYSTPMQSKIESSGSKYIFGISDSVAQRPADVPAAYTPTTRSVTPNLLEKAIQDQDDDELPDIVFRSSSPEIYKEDPPDVGFSIPPGRLRLAVRSSCKRRLDKDMDASAVKQACSFIKKNMPSSRREQLLAAMRPEFGASASNKKSRRDQNSKTRTPLSPLVSGTNR